MPFRRRALRWRRKRSKACRFALTPIYGVTIPVIVRLGNLEAKAALSNVRKVEEHGKPAISLDISRTGDRSTYGELRVLKAGVAEPIALLRGVAVYTEVGQRSVTHPDRTSAGRQCHRARLRSNMSSRPTPVR